MKLSEWFDPTNEYHINAYKHLQKTGTWPQGFIPDGVEIDRMWQVAVIHAIADQYLEEYSGKPVKAKPGPVQLTKKMKAAYFKEPNKCPSCKSENILGDEAEVVDTGDVVTQFVKCLNCELHWIDSYKLFDVALE